MADLFDDYPAGTAWDEMIGPEGEVRSAYRHVHSALAQLSAGELRARADTLARSYLKQGVTFDFAGEERPFPLDVVPRVMAGDEWEHVAPGVSQRVRALEAFLADVYGPQKAVADGWYRVRWSSPRRTSTALRGASSRPTACACTSRGSTWCGTRSGAGACSRTTCASRPA